MSMLTPSGPGVRRARKSTSGGAVLLGSHTARTWAKTQNTIAQSCAESELLAVVRATFEALGMMPLSADLGISHKTRIHVDASAALGIFERRGIGRVHHLDVGTFWIQEQAPRRAVEFAKAQGTSNPRRPNDEALVKIIRRTVRSGPRVGHP